MRLAARGLDLVGLCVDAWTPQRARALAWVAGLRTRPRGEGLGIDRSLRVAMCGRLVLAREKRHGLVTGWGLAHAWCSDRACPRCMATLQRKRAALLRAFCEPRMKRSLFVTCTQPKRAIDAENAGEAADRVLGRTREGEDTGHGYRALWRGSGGRFLRLFFAGGVRCLEVVLAKAGTRRRDGTIVDVTGWHAHVHQLLEVADPSRLLVSRASKKAKRPPKPETACKKAIRWVRLRLRALEGDERMAVRDEVRRLNSIARSLQKLALRLELGEDVSNEWSDIARRVVLMRWLLVCPGAEAKAQDVQKADRERVGQCTKYITKPFEIRESRYARELFVALDSRKAIKAWGSWRPWAKELEGDEEDDDEVDVEVSRTPVRVLFDALDGRQHFFGGPQVYIDFGDYEVSADAQRVMDDIHAVGGTFAARKKSPAFDDDLAQMRHAVRRGAGRLRLNALGLFVHDTPSQTWVPPPYAVRDVLERRAAELEESYKRHLGMAAELKDERAAVRRELLATRDDVSDSDVDFELVRRFSADWRRERGAEPLRDHIARLERDVVELRSMLERASMFGDRDELEQTLHAREAELDECRAILRSTPARDFSREEGLEVFTALRHLPDAHAILGASQQRKAAGELGDEPAHRNRALIP